jgi:hypothetical protein
MFDALVFVVLIGVWLFGLIDCARSDQDTQRNLPKWAWLLIIIFLGSPGAIAWLVIGRPMSARQPRLRPKRILPPDDNPEFLKKL